MEAKVGLKYDEGKIRYDLWPIGVYEGVAKILTFGANKYEENSWQKVTPKSRYYAAGMRHLMAQLKWEKEGNKGLALDEESGLPHMYHAVTNFVFYSELTNNIDE